MVRMTLVKVLKRPVMTELSMAPIATRGRELEGVMPLKVLWKKLTGKDLS
jgi:hypothetical protein